MSLAKLLNRIILILFVIGASLLFMLEVTTVRQSILDQMSANLETAITALGLVLQGTLLNDDKVLAETIVNAMFDGGFVSSVTLLDPDGQPLFQKIFHTAQQNVPSWLPSVIDMPPVKIEQELTDGWRMLGTLTLEGHTGYAYQHLWNAISRTGLALLAGLLIFTLVISWVCSRLLRPLEQINQQLVRIRKRQFSGSLESPWLQDLKELVISVNQLVSERKRDLLQQRLKVTQLGKQQTVTAELPLQGLMDEEEGMQQQYFFSTQGKIRLYSRLVPTISPSQDSSPDEIQHLLELWLRNPAEGLQLPLSLLNHADWTQFAPLLAKARGKTLDWRWDLASFPPLGEERLATLQEQGVEMAFSAIPMTNDTFNQLDPINPVFISCQPTQDPLYWNLVAQCLHSSGYTLLAEASEIQDINTLRAWGIDGYASKEAS
ncbi:LapD/MoxY N-terminal periplasmic domain-containing protein [Aeromonas salmonicida]|uniref:LapD/MoxY N-terminal periplasmic domain-containing protein n=1 Tax=Aeromonas salmonicida TaxID=645 RepID=UPI0022409205|nr:LapD/MoxY N-terminal periplasmic domain-containing protein [Aeromonas salmonicida]MDF8329507.1 LapD/MoxY N-terminal periplasmic domain-containing protein [Aeromonas salmonicida]